MTEYEYVAYGTGRAQIRDPDGTVRDATPDELVRLGHIYEPYLKESFRVVVSETMLPDCAANSILDLLTPTSGRPK